MGKFEEPKFTQFQFLKDGGPNWKQSDTRSRGVEIHIKVLAPNFAWGYL